MWYQLVSFIIIIIIIVIVIIVIVIIVIVIIGEIRKVFLPLGCTP